MKDPRVRQLAEVLVNYSIQKNGCFVHNKLLELNPRA